MILYATFVIFYLPCLATSSTLKHAPETRAMAAIGTLTVVIALLSALMLRGAASIMLR